MGKYRLLAELGRGGMADVFLSVAAGPGGFHKLLVIKQLRAIEDPMMLTMFLDEAKLAARVSHPNIVQTFEVIHEADRAYMVMEYLDGPSLARLRRSAAKKNTRVPLEIELYIMREVLSGLHYAHELADFDGRPLNVVHRDFTPQNIMTSFAGDAKIVDFGIAKALDQEGKTSAGIFKGKLSYAPLEQLSGGTIDRRTDLFSAGVMLYEAATGVSPWHGKTNAQVVQMLSTGQLPKAMENPSVPPELAAIVDQAMAIDPDDRFDSAEALRVAVDEFMRDRGLLIDRGHLSAYVASQMGEERERIRHVIELRLKDARSLPSAQTLHQSLPNIDALTPSPASRQLGRPVPLLSASEEQPDTNSRAPEIISSHTGQQSVVTVVHPATKYVLGGLGIIVVGLVVVVGMLIFRPHPPPVAAPAAPTAAVVPAAAVPPPPAVAPVVQVPVATPPPVEAPRPSAVRTVALRLQVTPASAQIYLDDLLLPSNPYEGSFPADDRLHEVRATAPGYLGVKRGVQFQENLALDLTLAREAPTARPARRVEPSPAPPTTAPPLAVERPPAEASDTEYFAPGTGAKKKQPKRSLDNVEFQ